MNSTNTEKGGEHFLLHDKAENSVATILNHGGTHSSIFVWSGGSLILIENQAYQ